MQVVIRLRNKMAGDKVIFSRVQEKGFFRLAPFSGVGASWLEQASPLRRQGTRFLFQGFLLPFLGGIQFWDGLEQKLCVGV